MADHSVERVSPDSHASEIDVSLEKSISVTDTTAAEDSPKELSEETNEVIIKAEDVVVPKTEEEWIQGIPLFMVIAGITLVVFLMLLDTSIVATAIPRITNQFHSLQDVGWYGSAYTLASASLQPLTGKFYTHFKSKWMFLGFFGIFELGSLICGVANSSKMLIVGRAIAGMGTSGMINGGLTIIAGSVPMHKRPVLIGMMMGVAQLGLVFGPLIGGAFTTYTTWRWCFFLNLPAGALVAVFLFFVRIPEQRQKGKAVEVLPTFFKTFDLFGFVLFAPFAIMFLLALEWGGNDYAWNSPTIIGLFCGAGATAVVFLVWEHRMGEGAMIPLHVIKNRIVWCSYIVMMALFGQTMVMAYYIPIYFQAVRGRTAIMSGVDLLPNILCQMVMAVGSGVLIGKMGYYLPYAIGSAVLSSIAFGLLSTLSPTTSTQNWAGYQALLGFGRGAGTQAPMLAVQNAVPVDELSTSMAILTFCQTFGGSVFLAVAQVIFSNGLRELIPKYAPSVNPELVIAAGATGFREVVSEEDLPAVLLAYSKSIDRTFYLSTALCVLHFIFAWGMGWKDISKKKEKPKDAEKAEEKVEEKAEEIEPAKKETEA